MLYTCIPLDKFMNTTKNYKDFHDNRYSITDSPELVITIVPQDGNAICKIELSETKLTAICLNSYKMAPNWRRLQFVIIIKLRDFILSIMNTLTAFSCVFTELFSFEEKITYCVIKLFNVGVIQF
jgi:hypothetical protein